MKKMIIVLATGIITTTAMAQENSKPVPPPPPPVDLTEMPAPPPPPPPPPAPPQPPKIEKVAFTPPVITNNKGYVIKVVRGKEDHIILVSKKGVTQKIRMSVWNAKPAYFENKYGELPPPPPPPPPAPPKPPVKS